MGTKVLQALSVVWMAAFPALAQDCATQAQQQAGQWVQGEDAGTGYTMTPLIKANRAGVARRIDRMAEVVRRAYPNPVGAEARWYRIVSTDYEPRYDGATYDLASNYKGYFCGQGGVPFLASETGTWAYVHVNSFGFKHLTYRVENVVIDGRQAYTLAPRVGTWGGFDLHDLTAPEEPEQQEQAVLITFQGKRPYQPVSKRAFLEANRSLVARQQQEAMDIARSMVEIRPLAEQEAEKQYYLDELEKSYTGDALQARKNRLLSDWRSDEEKLEEAVETARQSVQPLLDKIDRLLAGEAEAALRAPAVVPSRSWSLYDLSRYDPLFVPEDQGFMVITFDPAYFDAGMDKISPQFITVYWSWDLKYPFAQRFATQFREQLDLAALAAMLGR